MTNEFGLNLPPLNAWGIIEIDLRAWGGKKTLSNFTEYNQYATECRSIAAKMRAGEQKSQLLTIAAAWENLAVEAAKRTGRSGAPLQTGLDKLPGN